MDNDKFRSYKRIHKYEHPSDEEAKKIVKEKLAVAKAEKRTVNMLRRLSTVEPEELEELDEIYENMAKHQTISRKEKGNARQHKTRLKELAKRGEID